VFYFEPTQVKKRFQDWGPRGYQERTTTALRQFVEASRYWLTVIESNGADAAAAVWREVHAGRIAPSAGHIVSLWD
jgi:hypothetical protein